MKGVTVRFDSLFLDLTKPCGLGLGRGVTVLGSLVSP